LPNTRLLIDGYNVVSPVAAPQQRGGRTTDPAWLHRERMLLIRRLAKHLPADIREQTCVVFDAANPPQDRPSEYHVEGIEIRFAVDYPEADDLIEELILTHSAPKQLMVVSSDHRIQVAAKRRGCETFDSQSWLDELLDGKLSIQTKPGNPAGQGRGARTHEKPSGEVDPSEVDQWMKDFGFDK
tara:strand:+ start:281099 stop:281650 length:552 start_codon:yes stop_codon:yes gene_type:complete